MGVCLLLASCRRTPLTLLCVSMTLTAAHWHPSWGCLPWSFMAHCCLRAAGTKPLSMGQELLQTCCYQSRPSRPSPPGRGCPSSTMGWAGASEETRGWCLCCLPKAGPPGSSAFRSLVLLGSSSWDKHQHIEKLLSADVTEHCLLL